MTLQEKILVIKTSDEYGTFLRVIRGCDKPMRANKEACTLLLDERGLSLSAATISEMTDDEWETFLNEYIQRKERV
jgi:hypothetical protein